MSGLGSGAFMDEEKIQKLKNLRDKFRSLAPKERETLSVCFLKVKLGVNNEQELKNMKVFLGDFRVSLKPENLDNLINYMHSKSHSLPAFIAMEDSITEIEAMESGSLRKSSLPDYDVDQVETIREKFSPVKK